MSEGKSSLFKDVPIGALVVIRSVDPYYWKKINNNLRGNVELICVDDSNKGWGTLGMRSSYSQNDTIMWCEDEEVVP